MKTNLKALMALVLAASGAAVWGMGVVYVWMLLTPHSTMSPAAMSLAFGGASALVSLALAVSLGFPGYLASRAFGIANRQTAFIAGTFLSLVVPAYLMATSKNHQGIWLVGFLGLSLTEGLFGTWVFTVLAKIPWKQNVRQQSAA